jgi:hypothetical protein
MCEGGEGSQAGEGETFMAMGAARFTVCTLLLVGLSFSLLLAKARALEESLGPLVIIC